MAKNLNAGVELLVFRHESFVEIQPPPLTLPHKIPKAIILIIT